MAARKINKNFKHLVAAQQHPDINGAVLEGSSRSGKTWASVDFLIHLLNNIETKGGCSVHIMKETYSSFKTTLYEDFNRRLPVYGIPSPFEGMKEVSSFWLLGHKISLIGADKSSIAHGSGCDYLWINESLDVEQPVFDQKEMRCRKFFWMDYNPKVTEHYIYNKVVPRSDVAYLKTTFLDNPYISRIEKNKILLSEPTHPEDRHLEEAKRRPHPINVKNGTADKYFWKVYGLGLREAREGLIYPNVTWIDSFPADIERVSYGLDFGYTNHPTAIVKAGKSGNNLYFEKLLYEPTEDFNTLEPLYRACVPEGSHCWCDSADAVGMIGDLNRAGHIAVAVNKFNGSVKYGIDLIKRHKIHIVRSPEFRKEQENYIWKVVNGIKLNEPVKKLDDLWDAARYVAMSEFREEYEG